MSVTWSLLVTAVVGSGPFVSGGEMSGGPYPNVYSGGSVGEMSAHGFSGGYGDQLYPYDNQQPWQHGYFQEIPAYGGYQYFRPYNYKHLLSQSQTAAGFGMSPVMPYSQQFWHRYENRANLSPYANEPGALPPAPMGPGYDPRLGYRQPLPVIIPAGNESPAGSSRWGRYK